jgi:hypothetical protein
VGRTLHRNWRSNFFVANWNFRTGVEPVPLLYQLVLGCVNSHNGRPLKVSGKD